MKPLSFSLSALALPVLAGIAIWASRSLGVFRQHLISFWACVFSVVWFAYWTWSLNFFQPASVLLVMYSVLIIYVKQNYFSDSVALFFSCGCVTGVLLSAYSSLQWFWVLGAVLGLGCESILGYKKHADYRGLCTMMVLLLPKLPWYLGGVLAVIVCGLGGYYTALYPVTSRKDDVWRHWLISLVCILLIQGQVLSQGYAVLQGIHIFVALTILAGLWDKKYSQPFPYIVSILCAPWMYIVTQNMTWTVSAMGLVHWAHYILMHHPVNEGPPITRTMAYGILGGMGSVCVISGLLGVWSIISQGRGDTLGLVIYGVSCIVQFEGLYSTLRSKKITQSTALEVYLVCIGIVAWSLWSGWIINRHIFFQFIPKL